ncbi:hypothetical protein FCULG_00001192 [Fusarium culmorum]|uniref:Uncharacterized protein n=1 Tax=Fusarium culmorum TaxID=5516 RepID=A0A2T4GPB1_FUSCU|nr:hypothetical protein FCULG_00001192 [Fusarium culmorum]
MPPKQPRKRKPVASQTSSQRRHRAASAIPSTLISQPMSSSQVAKKRRVSDGNERIAETPQENKRRAMGSKGQQTPERTTQLAQATSPSTPFEVSSAESSDSDCQIKKVLPSPKRKLVAASPRGRPAKRARMERSITPSPADESDCVIEKVLPSPKRRQVEQKKRNIKRRRVGDCSDSPVCIESDVDSGAEDVNSLPEPTQTQTPEELREHSPSIVDALLAWLDGPQSGGAASEAAQPTSPPAIANLRSKDWKSSQPKNIYRPLTPLPKTTQWLRQRKELEPLTYIIDETVTEDAASDQGTPSKPPTERVNRTTQKLIKAEPQSSDKDDSGMNVHVELKSG